MSNLQEIETRRDRIAGTVAELQRSLDELDGSEELVSVQKMSNDLDAATRLLAALDRQLTQAYAQQRAAERAELERQRTAAAAAAAKVDADIHRELWPLWELVERRVAITAPHMNLAGESARLRSAVLALMQSSGYDIATGPGTGYVASPVRR